MSRLIKRREILIGGGVLAGGVIAGNWSRLADSGSYSGLLRAGEDFNLHAQRLALLNRPFVREYRRDQISKHFPVNGGIGAAYIDSYNPTYSGLLANDFRDWRLQVGGLVRRPIGLSLDQLRSMPPQSQITMHCCDEGWSAIAEWTGVQLKRVLALTGIDPRARYVVFHCLDTVNGQPWYGSIDLLDAMHPQTILAYAMNGQPLAVGHGAPLRLRVELQIGYKNLKHLKSITLADSLKGFGGGFGGTPEDAGYQWYGGL